MKTTEIRKLAHAVPFRPFRLHLADGRKLDVRHPDYLFVFNRSPYIAVEHDDGSHDLVNLPIVTSVKVLAPPRTRRRRRRPPRSR